MPFGINLRSDHQSADSIRSLWQMCNVLQESPSMAALGYPPHITLAVYDNIETNLLFDALDAATEDIP